MEEIIYTNVSDSYLKDRKTPSIAIEQNLLREVNFRCPLCDKILRRKDQKKGNKLYEIAHIYPNSPTPEQVEELKGLERLGDNSESIYNLIPLCKDCHRAQDFHTTKEDYLKLLTIKKNLVKQIKIQDIMEEINMESEIAKIIKGICNLPESEFVKLNYAPVNIEKKFYSNEYLLKNKIASYVTMYYTYIRDLFSEVDKKSSNTFTIISQEFKLCFTKISRETDDKSLIFNEMVNWINSKVSNNSTEACEAIVSFFIQNCEVFYEISQ